MAKFIRSILVGICMAAGVALGDDQPAEQKASQLDVKVTVRMNYLLYLPKDYSKEKPSPLVLFLHGAGERGDDLELVKVHGPPKLIAAGKEFPFIVVSPQCPKEHWWEPIELVALLDDLQAKYNVDADRIYITGLSMGAFGTWRLAAHIPDRIAAIVPICGGGEPFFGRKIAPIPTWVFHGAKDEAVPLARSEMMVEAIKKAGGNPKFTVYPEAEHDSWTATYNDPAVWEWLVQQKRASK